MGDYYLASAIGILVYMSSKIYEHMYVHIPVYYLIPNKTKHGTFANQPDAPTDVQFERKRVKWAAVQPSYCRI